MGYKFPVDAGSVCDKSSVTAAMPRDMIGGRECRRTYL